MYKRKWKPSKTAKRKFAQQMNRIDKFCRDNNISQSRSSDSYYFTLNGIKYRVSNHFVDPWHDGRKRNVRYIHASKTRLIDIYNDIKQGYDLDGRGCRK